MTVGHGVSHSEEATGHYEGMLEAIQHWIAQPDETRDRPPAFEHHTALSRRDTGGGAATILIGVFDGLESPARHDSDLIGVDLSLQTSTSLPLRAAFEHGLIVLEGALSVEGRRLSPGHLGYLAAGRDVLDLDVAQPTWAILLSGVPFEEMIQMCWNFVGRSHEDIDDAHESWLTDDGRFSTVASPLARIETKAPSWRQACHCDRRPPRARLPVTGACRGAPAGRRHRSSSFRRRWRSRTNGSSGARCGWSRWAR
jgi:redox-sensitive bicupin YhaK (pirin superfamily)